jgi:hypothetical protein
MVHCKYENGSGEPVNDKSFQIAQQSHVHSTNSDYSTLLTIEYL